MVRNVDNLPPVGPVALILTPQQLSQRTLVVLERQIDDAIATRAGSVDINFAATQVIDSAGLNWLATTQTRLATANMRLRLIDVPTIVSDILLATRLDTRFTIVAGERGGGESCLI